MLQLIPFCRDLMRTTTNRKKSPEERGCAHFEKRWVWLCIYTKRYCWTGFLWISNNAKRLFSHFAAFNHAHKLEICRSFSLTNNAKWKIKMRQPIQYNARQSAHKTKRPCNINKSVPNINHNYTNFLMWMCVLFNFFSFFCAWVWWRTRAHTI